MKDLFGKKHAVNVPAMSFGFFLDFRNWFIIPYYVGGKALSAVHGNINNKHSFGWLCFNFTVITK